MAIGNLLRGDDGVAWRVAEEVRRRRKGVTVIARQQLLPEFADAIARACRVVFVDARVGPEPGRVRCARAQPAEGASPLGHVLAPGHLLALAGGLYGRVPDAYLVTVEAHRFDYGQALSAAVEAAVPRAASRVLALI
jgi:hydrogenase maturation protease